MKETYELLTDDISHIQPFASLLPAAENVNDDRTVFIGPWLRVLKVRIFKDGILSEEFDCDSVLFPIFTCKILYDGEIKHALYKPWCRRQKELEIINFEKQS